MTSSLASSFATAATAATSHGPSCSKSLAISSSLNGLLGSRPPSFGDRNGDAGESWPPPEPPSFLGVDGFDVPPSATVGRPSTELLFLCFGDLAVLTISFFLAVGDAASYSRSCDVDVRPSSFILRILLLGDSSDSCRGALALSSLCMAATRSMGSPPGGAGLARPGGESAGVSVALPGLLSFLSTACDLDLRILRDSSRRFAAASRSACTFMSV